MPQAYLVDTYIYQKLIYLIVLEIFQNWEKDAEESQT